MRAFLAVGLLSGVLIYGCAGGGGSQSFTGDDTDGGGQPETGPGSSSGGGSDAEAGGPTAPPDASSCVHNTDCTSASLCSPTGGYQCLGGFCIPTGKPMNCDDGVPCTDDACNATSNKCTHTANDAQLPERRVLRHRR